MTAPYSGRQTRRNIVAFLAGKVPTALLTAAVLGLSARVLPAADFGYYVIGMAFIELALGLSTLGLDWVLLRFIPDVRLHGNRRALAGLVSGVLCGRLLVLSAVAACMLLWRDALHAATGFPPELAGILAALLVVEGGMRVLRDNTLEAMAMQSCMQIATLLKGSIVAAALLAMGRGDAHGTAQGLLLAELAAASATLLLSAGFVLYAMRALPPLPQPGWRRASFAQMRRVAQHNYASGIVEYLYSPSFLLLLLARVQTPEAMAGVGFVLRLTDIIRNYMPGMVIFSVVRSRMIGAYAGNGDYAELQRWAHFVFKISALTLLPVLAVAVVYGDLVLRLASGGRFAEYHALFAVLCAWLALRLHRLILNVVCNAIGLMGMWARAALCSLFVLPILYLVGFEHLGVWFVAMALLGNEIVINSMVVAGMRAQGFLWPLGLRWWSRALAALVAAMFVAWLVPGQSVLAAIAGGLLLCAVFVVALLLSGVIDKMDRNLINRALGRQLLSEA
ncbi:lipopolysaccharide biosynthesis protein [Pseudoduganella sp. RAF53_2]|uniref:lipopolysaccharide biosynthesis protein n=1 Tax=unclassified Pseudoduganella TaxID=2637179 RepID=UPI003F9BC4AC